MHSLSRYLLEGTYIGDHVILPAVQIEAMTAIKGCARRLLHRRPHVSV